MKKHFKITTHYQHVVHRSNHSKTGLNILNTYVNRQHEVSLLSETNIHIR